MSVISGPVGAVLGSNAAGDAADTASAASDRAMQLQREIYETNRGDMMPFLEHAEQMLAYDESANAHADTMRAGHRAAQSEFQSLWAEGPGKYEDSDWYKDTQASIDYAIEKAQKEMGVGATATGQQYGRKLTEYAVPMAAEATRAGRGNFINEWINTRLNPLQQNINSLAGYGAAVNPAMNLVPGMISNATNAGAGMADTVMSGGAAEAGGILGQGQAWQQGVGGIGAGAGLAAALLLGGKGGGGGGGTGGTVGSGFKIGGDWSNMLEKQFGSGIPGS